MTRCLRKCAAGTAIAASLGLFLLSCGSGKNGQAAVSMHDGTGVTVAYFHTTYRDPTCRKIESLAREAIARSFASEMESGALRFVVFDIDKEDNKHFVQDYQLSMRTLVVSRHENGAEKSWKSLDKVYEMIGVPEQYTGYVLSAVKEALDQVH